jgi:uncharacterized membrane protein
MEESYVCVIYVACKDAELQASLFRMRFREMTFSPLLLFHICGGLLGVLSGAAALLVRKGSDRHRLAGNVFVISMLSMSASGVVLAVLRDQTGNILGGTLTFYLVITAWMTVRRRAVERRGFDRGALLLALAIVAVALTWGLEATASPTGLSHGYPVGVYGFLGSIALLATIGDIRLLVRGGSSGVPRIARHLWRMCFALFIAAASIFLAREQIFPAVLRTTGTLYILSFLPLVLMVFWLTRVRIANAFRRLPMPRETGP